MKKHPKNNMEQNKSPIHAPAAYSPVHWEKLILLMHFRAPHNMVKFTNYFDMLTDFSYIKISLL